MSAAAVPAGTPVNIVGLAQGVVIGDHNTVHVHTVKHDEFVPREAPPVPQHWVARPELQAAVARAIASGGIVALVGMGGSGKSMLAARVAGETAPLFKDGCVWVDTVSEDPEQALARIALAFGHDIAALTSLAARAQTVRSLLAGRRLLLVLDDVTRPESTAPFLPLPADCAALITTRNDAVAARLASEVIPVDRLAPGEAVSLLETVSGMTSSPPMAHLAELLGGLPLALELAGKLARKQSRRPGFGWDAFVARLATGAQRLDLGLAGASVRAAFDGTWTQGLQPAVHRAFALLGLFEPGEISTAEAAAAWHIADDQAVGVLDDLIDLSLVRLVDRVTIQLHPLLADYAGEKAGELTADERTAAHLRLADHLFERAPRPPRTLADIRYVLRSHAHAGAALDRQRASRVYPWFGEPEATAVPGFLIDRGQFHAIVRHQRIELALARDLSPWARSWHLFRLAEALQRTGDLPEAGEHVHEALAIMDGAQVDDDGRAIGLAKFLMLAGQIEARLGRSEAAEALFRRAADLDKELDARGNVGGALSGALTSLLQLGDLLEERGTDDGDSRAKTIFEDVLARAEARGQVDLAVMAKYRLARLHQHTDPHYALRCVREARVIGANNQHAFAGRQGARYARQLARLSADMALNGQDSVDDALDLLVSAIRSAGACDAEQELAWSLYELGNLMEHYGQLRRDSPLAASWAAYALAERFSREADGGGPNARERIETRIAPRLSPDERRAIAAAVERDPWALIDQALSPLSVGWRPAART